MNNKLLFISLLCIACLFSCKKDDETTCATPAVIRFAGSLAVDGCGWVVIIDSVRYHPESLDAALRVDSLLVNVDWQITGDTFICGWGIQMQEAELTCVTQR